MSLWRQKSAIGRAVAGQLSADDEAKLRGHLAGCVECRRYYDALTVQARILAGDPHSSAAGAEREMARVMAALNPKATAAPQNVPSWWPRFALAAGVAAAVVFGVVSWKEANFQRPEEVQMRGDASTHLGALFGVWVVTAGQDGGELRRDVSFPADESARVHSTDWIAFTPKGVAKVQFFRVVLLNEKGETIVLEAGKSVALDSGKWRAFAVGLTAPDLDTAEFSEEETLANAAREAGVNGRSLKLTHRSAHPMFQTSGAIFVQP